MNQVHFVTKTSTKDTFEQTSNSVSEFANQIYLSFYGS